MNQTDRIIYPNEIKGTMAGVNAGLMPQAESGFLLTDAGATITAVSEKIAELLGVSKDLLIGKSLDSFVDKSDHATLHNLLKQLDRTDRVQTARIHLQAAVGGFFAAFISVEPLASASQEGTVLCWQIQDVSRRLPVEQRLRRAHEELDKKIKMQNLELARANRELRAEIAERQRAEDKIRRQNEFLNHVLESLPHPFYVLDANNYKIKMANSAAAVGELTENTTCYALTHRRSMPCDGSEHICPLRTVKETKKPVIVEHIHYDKEGNPRNMEVHGYPIFDEHGEVEQMIEYSLDITERKRLEEKLRDNAEKIKMFAYTISHDLKSPLIGIHGLIKLLSRKYGQLLDDTGRKYCDQVLKASKQVVSLIEELNVFIRTKETPLTFEMVDPKEVFQTIKEEFSPLLGIRNISWSEPSTVPSLKADRLSLLRVFRNLVDNALKYGGDQLGKIEIGYRESEKFHIFSVRDDGVGIEQEDCEAIFGAFQRNETSRGVEGTGLGLAIVKEIATKHGGKVWAEQNPDRGVTFNVSLSKSLE